MTFPVGVELKIDGTWTDVSTRARRVPPSIRRGRPDETSVVAPTSTEIVFDNTDGALSPRNPTSAWYPHIKRGLPCRISVEAGNPYLLLSGAAGGRATTPDNAALDITGDLWIGVELSAGVHLPAAGTRHELAAKWNTTGDQRSYHFGIDEFGRIVLFWSTAGTAGTVTSAVSTYSVPMRTAGPVSFSALLDVNFGGAVHIGIFHGVPGTLDDLLLALNADETQVRLGDPFVGSGTTSIFSGTAAFEIGDITGGADVTYPGGVRRVQLRSGVAGWAGTIAADPDFTIQDVGDTSFTDSAGRSWTVQGDAEITNRQIRFVGSTSAIALDWPKATGRTGSDTGVATATFTVAGMLRQLQQGAKPLHSALYRLVTSTQVEDTVAAYWPLEDGPDARLIASPIQGVASGAITRGATLASDDSLDASEPLPHVDAGTLFRYRFDIPPTITANTNWQSTMVVNIPVAPTSGEIQMMVVDTSALGNHTWGLQISSSVVRLRILDYEGTEIVNDTISADPRMFGTWMLVSLNVTQNGAATDWDYDLIVIPDGFGFGDSGSVAISFAGTPTRIRGGSTVPASATDGWSFGHFIITTNQATGWLAGADTAWIDETAAHRFYRLCREEGIPYTVIGDNTMVDFFRGNTELSELMGPQKPDTLPNLLQECADADHGILYELRDQPGLAFRTHKSLQNQIPRLVFDASEPGLSAPFQPVLDDQRLRNDITVKCVDSSSTRLVDQDSVDSEGIYDEEITLNLANDEQCPNQASWRLHLGTWPELRLPEIAARFATAPTSLVTDWSDVDLGDAVVATNLMRQYDRDVALLLENYNETLSLFNWETGIVGSPAGPWEVGVRGGDTADTETFNKANGALGPVFTWTQEVFASGPHDWEVLTNQARFFVNTAGAHEDLQIPSPNITTPRQRMSFDVTNLTRTGTGSYWISAGFTARTEINEDGTDYRAYACEIGRNNQVVNGVDLWFLIIWRIDSKTQSATNPTIIAVDSAPLADVTLPGVLTFVCDGERLSATFTHAGGGGTLTAAVIDATYPDGIIGLGGGNTITSGDSGSITIDNFSYLPIRDRRDTAGSQLNTAIDSDDTSLSVATTLGPVWTAVDSDCPFDIEVAGELMTVIDVSGTSSPQTFTVIRSVNGVVKSHSSGAALSLWRPAVRAL